MGDGPFGRALPDHVRTLVRYLCGDAGPPQQTVSLDEAVIELAFSEGVAPLLGARVADGSVTVPDQRREELLWVHQLCIAGNLLRSQVLHDLVRRCRRRGIDVLPLKGMALIQTVMAGGERSMGDIDVLVPPSRWQEACAVAEGAGFKEQQQPRRTYTANHDYVRSFSTPELVTVEIHRFVCEETIFTPDYDGPEGIFARAHRNAGGSLLLETGDLFLTLVAHAAKHTFELPLRSYLDGVILLRRSELPLSVLAERARSWRMEAAFQAWMRSLQLLQGGDETGQGTVWRALGDGWARIVWTHTTHASPWQRFLRLAWLMDGPARWLRHVATRSFLRGVDAVSSRSGST